LVGRDALKEGVDSVDDIDFGKVVSARESSFGEWFEIWVSLQIVALAIKRTALCQGGVR
jgi:hypothetical protein